MGNKMVNILKLVDIFPQDFSFTYKGRKHLKTSWGGIISIFSFFSILINAILIGNDIYFRENPKVIEVTKKEKLAPTFRLNNNNTKIGFSISDSYSNLVDDESYFQFIPKYYIQTK